MTEFYISFATADEFRGGTIVTAIDQEAGLAVATSMGRNPGGEALIVEVPAEVSEEPDVQILRTKLAGREEMIAMGGCRRRDLPEDVKDKIEDSAVTVCEDCNEGNSETKAH